MKLLRSPGILWTLPLLLLMIVVLFAPQLAPYNPLYAEPLRQFAPPAQEHWLGLDQLGRDVMSRLIWGTRYTVLTATLSTGIALLLGLVVGGVAGAAGGWVEQLLMRCVDVFLSFPGLLLALVAVAVLGEGRWQVAAAVGLSLAPIYARVVRAAMLSVRVESYIEATYALGASRWRVLWGHLLPNAMGQISAMGSVVLAWALVNGAALEFLGLAGSPSAPSWGRMINEGRAFLGTAPWIAVAPGVLLTLAVVSVMGLRDSWRGR